MSLNPFASKLVRILFSLQMENIADYLFPVIVAALLSYSGAEPAQMNKINNSLRELNKHENKKASLAATLGCVFVAILCFIMFQLYVCHEFSEENHRNPIMKAMEKCPIFVYSKLKRLRTGISAVECAVCLTEFGERETIKMLPKCKHVFHQQCIDAWLPSRMTCPICRRSVTDDTMVDIMEHRQQELGSISTGYIESEVAVTATATAPQPQHPISRTEVDCLKQNLQRTEHVVTETDSVVGQARESRRLWRSFSTGHSLESFTEMFPGWFASLTPPRSGGGVPSSTTEPKTSSDILPV